MLHWPKKSLVMSFYYINFDQNGPPYILCVRLTIKVKVGIPDSLKVGWYLPKKTGSSHLNNVWNLNSISMLSRILRAEIGRFKTEFRL